MPTCNIALETDMATEAEHVLRPHPEAKTRRLERLSLFNVVALLAPFALAFAVYLAVFLVMRPEPQGDEPHYLITAESIAYDHDVDLRNDYASRERVTRVVNTFPLTPNAGVYKSSGELRPMRGVGLPAVLAVGFRLDGVNGARVVMILLAALMADQLYRLLRDLRLRRRYRFPAWAAVVFCLPIVAFSSQVYPELPGALLVIVALRVMVKGASRPAALGLGSAASAALIWLHPRFILLSMATFAGLAVAPCVQGWSSGARGPGVHGVIQGLRAFVVRCGGVLAKQWRTVTLPVVLPYAILVGSLGAAYQYWYGSPDPRTPYEALGSNTVGSGGWDFWYQFAVRDLLDPAVGWIPFAPVHWLGFAALGCLVVWFGWRAMACIGAAAGYELLVASVGPNIGWGMPGRYPMVVIPLIAIPLALVIQELRAARVLFVPLFAASVLFAAVAINDYQGLYPLGDKPRMFALRTTSAAFPRVRLARLSSSFTDVPNQDAHQTGRVRGETIVAKAGRDGPGFLLWGPYALLKEGTYRATFPLSVTGAPSKVPVAVIDAAGTPPWKLFARRTVDAGELRDRRVSLQFKTPGGYFAETRVFYTGRGTLRVGPVHVEAVRLAESHRLPAWLLTSLWVIGTILVGWLFVRMMPRRPSRRTA
jgi:hypothetical protein